MTLKMKFADPSGAKRYFADKLEFTTGPIELDHMIRQGDPLVIVDVRTADDYAQEHIPGSINLPENEWHTLKGLSRDQTNILMCYSEVCHLAARAALAFASQGYPVMELDGGMRAWKQHGLPVESSSPEENKRSA